MSQQIEHLSFILLCIFHVLTRVDWVNLKAYFFHSVQSVMTLLNPFMMHEKKNLYILKSSKLVNLATDGTSSMLGMHNGFAAKLKIDVTGLFNVHCITHREALAASDAFKKIKQLGSLERLANRVYSWVGMSSLQIENCKVC